MRILPLIVFGFLAATAPSALAQDGQQRLIIKGFGDITPIEDERLSSETTFKVAFDIAAAGDADAPSRRLVTPARFLNMHAAAGVPAENMQIAIVVHGAAHKDLLTEAARGAPNPNAELIAELLAAGARIELCGQTAGYYNLKQEDLLPGVFISLSAMTSHALLQQEGFTLNPF